MTWKTALLVAAPAAPCPATCHEDFGIAIGGIAGIAIGLGILWGLGWVFSRGWAAARDSWRYRPRRIKVPKATARERK